MRLPPLVVTLGVPIANVPATALVFVSVNVSVIDAPARTFLVAATGASVRKSPVFVNAHVI